MRKKIFVGIISAILATSLAYAAVSYFQTQTTFHGYINGIGCAYLVDWSQSGPQESDKILDVTLNLTQGQVLNWGGPTGTLAVWNDGAATISWHWNVTTSNAGITVNTTSGIFQQNVDYQLSPNDRTQGFVFVFTIAPDAPLGPFSLTVNFWSSS